ncbi:hypothetical protein LGH82_22425 [Mesorhizobium sp. PAMC28654]|uniref:hypothetical protein n=1 Tax=Mesorhizobium sp. PAMC28654 TaxID=2880934 RepID=UPI001D09FB06|nr:hypothetical protein [Mesorhizobium sp. PAMC28654]UDL87903.1 hypothetical protein LGH82_22425 [Mesorhizobium sp. PAMC28654]
MELLSSLGADACKPNPLLRERLLDMHVTVEIHPPLRPRQHPARDEARMHLSAIRRADTVGAKGRVRSCCRGAVLKRVAFEQIHVTRFKPLFLCMSLPQNRCALLGDMY